MTGRRVRGAGKRRLLKWGLPLYIVMCLFSSVWLSSAVTNLEYEIGRLDKVRADLLKQGKVVMAQRESSFTMEKIEHAAIKRLGMKMPERGNIIFVRTVRSAGAFKASLK